MAIRLSRGVLPDGHLDLTLWNGNVLAGLPVGRCDCGGWATGQRITRGRRVVFADAECRKCGALASLPVVDQPEPVAA